MPGTDTYLESDGKAVEVTLSYATDKNVVAYVEQWLGITKVSGASGDNVWLSVDEREYQFTVPSTLSVSKGDIVYIEAAVVTGTHVPPDAAYGTSSGAGKLPLFKATAAKDANNVVTGILLKPV